MRRPRGPTPPRPQEKTFSVSFRYTTVQHADAAAYKGYVVVTMPSPRESLSPADARKLAGAIVDAASVQEQIDDWARRYEPRGPSGLVARRRRARRRS